MTQPDSIVDFANPPVNEVVCGIQFEPLKELLVPHFGLLWDKFKKDYPQCKEVNPLAKSIENWDTDKELEINVSDVPPLPRVWFIHKNNNEIIQVQSDRFLYNWRKNKPEDEYPRYKNVIGAFKNHLSAFKECIKENSLGAMKPTQYELTYINYIYQKDGWETLNNVSNIFPDFSWRSDKSRFLPDIEGINLRTFFTLPKREGRLHVILNNGVLQKNKLPIIRMDLTVRGIRKNDSQEIVWEWFDVAREWIVRGFLDLTSEEIQKKSWGLIND